MVAGPVHREEMSEVRLNVGKQHHVVVIGAGFAGLSAACSLAKEGFKVTVLDKQPEVGGRCRVWEKDGFTFDMGPSWYWMPDVFDEFFARFGKKTSDYYRLRRLDPPYRLFMENGRPLDIPDRVQALEDLFESTQPGCRGQFRKFMAQAEYKYKVAMGDYVRRPSLALSEFIDVRMLREVMRLNMLSSQSSHVKGFFKHPDLVKIMEWPVLFLGGAPSSVPAMYSMMNYASVVLGTHYPDGGMVQVPLAMRRVAEELGVEFKLGERFNVDRICCEGGKATGVEAKGGFFAADFVVATGDYHHIEKSTLPKELRNYTDEFWDKQTMSPSSLLFFIGCSKRLQNLRHHNLFFDESLEQHAKEIYDKPRWPSKPLFYVCVQSITDPATAPQGYENVFILIPLAAGLSDSEEMRERYFDMVMGRLERHTNQSVRDAIVLKRSYAMREFEDDFGSYKGNAYGLANTLLQTAVFKPAVRSFKVDNLYFAGQLTVPGPGVPPAIISGHIAATLVTKHRDMGYGASSTMTQLFLGFVRAPAAPFVFAAMLFLTLLAFFIALFPSVKL